MDLIPENIDANIERDKNRGTMSTHELLNELV